MLCGSTDGGGSDMPADAAAIGVDMYGCVVG
jgi:hypothetical protein